MPRNRFLAVATALAALMATLFVASPASAADLNWRHFVGVASNRCLDVDTNTNFKVQLWSCDSGSDESWGVSFVGTLPDGEGFYNIVNRRTNSCLTPNGFSTAVSTPVVMNSCNLSVTQLWYFPVKTGPVQTIVNVWSGLCLDARNNGTGNGTIVQIYTCNSTTAQQWRDVDV
ncbi:RICIN domain-containing protein [Actinoplanes sp. HUAS TT8]|uniref:RICIN domain-containing protein n=1 Tax=Actinoplanes sp. HUAS TT8 TaxID=3447453 RepID=UPI003F524780